MKRVMVTGATGMIGLALIKECLKHNTEVYACVRPDSARNRRLPDSGLLHVINAGLEDLQSVRIPEKDFDVFYHFGWSGTDRTGREDFFLQERNVGFTLNAVRLASDIGCKKFIGAGSQAEYGPVNGEIDDLTPLQAVSAYGIAKDSAGKMSRGLCSQLGLVHIWGRIFSVYGVNDKAGTMTDYAVRSFAAGRKAHFSEGSQVWNYLNEEDAGRVFYLMGEKICTDRVYRVAGSEQKKLRDYIYDIADLMDARDLCVFDREGGACPLMTDISPLEKELGFRPVVEFKEGIKRMIKAYEMDK